MHKAISACMKELASTSFYCNLLKEVEQANDTTDSNDTRIRQIICYGLGSFSHTSLSYFSAPLWQLACVLSLRSRLQQAGNAVDIHYFEPCSTKFEEAVLEELSVHVLTVNEKGKRHIQGVPTLFYMPHCPSLLYENVLWSNWDDVIGSTPLVLVGNSLRNYCDSLTTYDTSRPAMHRLLPWLSEQNLDWTKEDLEKAAGNFVGAFNDTYWTSVDVPAELTEWPDRPSEMVAPDEEVL